MTLFKLKRDASYPLDAYILIGLMLPAAPLLRHAPILVLALFLLAMLWLLTAWRLFALRTDRVRSMSRLVPNIALAWFVITTTFVLATYYSADSYLGLMSSTCIVIALGLCVLETSVLAHAFHDAYSNIRVYLLVGIGPAPYLLLVHAATTGTVDPRAAFDPQFFLDGDIYTYTAVSILPLLVGLLATCDASTEVMLLKGRKR